MVDERIRVLLVDDNPQDRALVVREVMQEFPAATIVEVIDQEHLDRALAEHDFNLAITDYQLLWNTGLEVLAAVKSSMPRCPVIMFTATGSEEVAVEAMKKGLDDYIIKNVRHLARLRGSARAVVEYAKNLEEVKRLEEELRARDSELAHLTRLATLGEMVAGIAHEINQPLHVIANYATGSLMKLNEVSQDVEYLRDSLEQISKNVTRAANILARYREFASRRRPDRSAFGINDLLRESVQLLAFEIRDHRVSIGWDLANSQPMVVADHDEICQVVVNLVRNACEAMLATDISDREITVSTRIVDGSAQISIQDRGHGLPEDGYENLLRPFVTAKPDGMGMGLAVSSRIVEAHGGRLWATSNQTHGATFHFTLPSVEQQEGER